MLRFQETFLRFMQLGICWWTAMSPLLSSRTVPNIFDPRRSVVATAPPNIRIFYWALSSCQTNAWGPGRVLSARFVDPSGNCMQCAFIRDNYSSISTVVTLHSVFIRQHVCSGYRTAAVQLCPSLLKLYFRYSSCYYWCTVLSSWVHYSVIFVLIYFLVLVSFQFYSIGDFRKHVMICLNIVHH